jgi:hypothetical protein
VCDWPLIFLCSILRIGMSRSLISMEEMRYLNFPSVRYEFNWSTQHTAIVSKKWSAHHVLPNPFEIHPVNEGLYLDPYEEGDFVWSIARSFDRSSSSIHR